MDDKEMAKKLFRTQAKKNLQSLAKKPNVLWLDARLTHILKRFWQDQLSRVSTKAPVNVLLYIPLDMEYDISKVLNLLRKQKKVNIFVPFIEKKSFKMVKYRMPLTKRQFGIFEPSRSFFRVRSVHLAFIPILGIDKNLQRVGFGKGMYDRFFEEFFSSFSSDFLKQKKIPKIIFISRMLNVYKGFICQSHDLVGDAVFTPFTPLGKRKLNGIDNCRYGVSAISRSRRVCELSCRKKDFYV